MGWIDLLMAIRYRIAVVVFCLGMTVGTFGSGYGLASFLFGITTLISVYLLVTKTRYVWELHMGPTIS